MNIKKKFTSGEQKKSKNGQLRVKALLREIKLLLQ